MPRIVVYDATAPGTEQRNLGPGKVEPENVPNAHGRGGRAYELGCTCPECLDAEFRLPSERDQ